LKLEIDGISSKMAFDTPPSSLMDSIANPKMKITKGRVEMRSFVCNISKVERRVRASRWD